METGCHPERDLGVGKAAWPSRVGVLTRATVPPRGYLAVSGDVFGCHTARGRGVLLASSGWKPGKLLHRLETPQKDLMFLALRRGLDDNFSSWGRGGEGFCPLPRERWQCLETFLVVITRDEEATGN